MTTVSKVWHCLCHVVVKLTACVGDLLHGDNKCCVACRRCMMVIMEVHFGDLLHDDSECFVPLLVIHGQ